MAEVVLAGAVVLGDVVATAVVVVVGDLLLPSRPLLLRNDRVRFLHCNYISPFVLLATAFSRCVQSVHRWIIIIGASDYQTIYRTAEIRGDYPIGTKNLSLPCGKLSGNNRFCEGNSTRLGDKITHPWNRPEIASTRLKSRPG